jgi:hypothetical protein
LLVADGWQLRCLARHPENFAPHVPQGVEVVQGDLLDAQSLPPIMAGIDTAFYLVHSMGTGGNFQKQDRHAAENFAAAARAAGVKRIIYLGGLGVSAAASERRQWGGIRFGNRIVDTHTVTLRVTQAAAFRPIERIGGSTGWYFGNALWQLRGWLDLLIGGVGMRRGRRDSEHLLPGDVVDCWRVESIEPPRHLRLAAEMKLPRRAWLEFDVQPAKGGVTLRQTATFDPVGLSGLAYWYALLPLHELVFRGMLRNLGRAAVTVAPIGA